MLGWAPTRHGPARCSVRHRGPRACRPRLPAELPARLLAPEARRLPVALHSVAQHGEALAVRVAHYPLLRRLADVYRG